MLQRVGAPLLINAPPAIYVPVNSTQQAPLFVNIYTIYASRNTNNRFQLENVIL